MNDKGQVEVQPHLEMGLLDDGAMHDLDDENGVYKSIKTVVFSNKLNLLLPFGPLAIMVHKMSASNAAGFLHWTYSGMTRVVHLSLLGSILSNMLLVLGCSFFCGGLVHHGKEQVFSKATAVVNSGLLLMAVMGLLFPAVLHYTHTERQVGKSELALSRFSSCVMLLAYATYLVFQLKSQEDTYVPVGEEGTINRENDDDYDDDDDDDEHDEAPEISKWESIIWLAIMTAWISILSDYLVDTIKCYLTPHNWECC
ncbi:Vacuolar cation/proton exchanger 2 [Hibiscus syriacus]|uniref:Vacuolar cation/proton exchanger 2 n=1 Tax=Hibiscus syriacus TaxID=106335 RepID=A0A6A3CE33_HIBSY|nr:Vacuolar cation/proton exchanger 2 [Hibiscus syriacus]